FTTSHSHSRTSTHHTRQSHDCESATLIPLYSYLIRYHLVMVLDHLNPLLLTRRRGHHEPRVGAVVSLEQLVFDLGLSEQVAAKVGFADHFAVLVIGIAELRHRDIGLNPAGLNRAAGRRVIARGGQPQRGIGAGLDDGLH